MKLIQMSEVQTEKVNWLWYPYIPFGKITLVQGDPGDGKTTFVLAVTALLTNGLPMPETPDAVEPVSVIYQTAEDGLSDTIKPRLEEVGANCSKVIVIDESEQALTLADDRIERAIVKTNAKLLILDPLQAYLGGDVDMHRANEVRPVFKALAGVAERTGCAILIIGHMNKMNGTKGLYRGLGSIDIAAAVRSILLVGRDKESVSTRVMAHLKSSLAPEGCPIAFELDRESGFRWVGAYNIAIDDLLNGSQTERGEPTKEAQAVSLIVEMLRDGEQPCNRIYDRLLSYGISRRTTENAKQIALIRSYKKGANWYWALP